MTERKAGGTEGNSWRPDEDLLIGIRKAELRALREFVLRFHPILMDQARRLEVDVADRGTVVTGFLDDILVKLAVSPAPRSLVSFVITAFRNCVTDAHREAAARERRVVEQEDLIGSERVVGAGCSEFMLRAARGVPASDSASSDATTDTNAVLVRMLLDVCTTEEKQLLVWSAHRVPLRDCAEWLGISYDSAKQRLARLRGRLVRECVNRLPELGESDRAGAVRLLERAGVNTGAGTNGESAA